MFDIRVHCVCVNPDCGRPGIARIRPGRTPGDVEFECGCCGATNVAACAPGIRAAAGLEAPDDLAVVEEPWLVARRRAVGLPAAGAVRSDVELELGRLR
jgi:hypothetical protein